MNISYNWLQEYSKSSLSPYNLGEKFRLTSSEVDSILNISEKLNGLLVGKVLKVEAHPNADRLRIAKVSLGDNTKTIVCGAPNLEEGQTVVVALPGVTIYPLKAEPVTLKQAKIRGIESEGMLASAEEIGLPLASEGILILPSNLKAGDKLINALNLDDQVLDLEITPNRPDLLSYIGLAREISAFEKKRLVFPPIYTISEEETRLDSKIEVKLENPEHCYRYSGIALSNLKVEPSPLWLQLKLALSGFKPINNVVDVTNYVLLELGQPLHAFDLEKLKGDNITVRNSKGHESVEVLDNTVRQCKAGDILICNGQKVIALAGIIGGVQSGISDSTEKVFLESANFHGPQIRRTSRRLGLRTEASHRFEKGLDPELTITALKRAVYLLKELCPEMVLDSNIFDLYNSPERDRPRIHLDFTRIQQLIGIYIPVPEAKIILQKLGFQIPSINKSSLEAIAPSWRKDIKITEDLIEELVRIWGYERIPTTLPSGSIKAPRVNVFFKDKQTIRETLAALGLHETVHQSFCALSELEKIGFNKNILLPLENPLSAETEYLSPSHLPAFMMNLSRSNLNQTEIGLFEIGHVFNSDKSEVEKLSIIIRSSRDVEDLYREVKTYLNRVFFKLKLDPNQISYKETDNSIAYYSDKSQLDISLNESSLGQFGLLSDSVIKDFKIRSGKNILFLEINLDQLLLLPKADRSFMPISIYPSTERDLSLIVDKEMPAKDLVDLIEKSINSELVKTWNVTSVYSGNPLEETQKSITIHFVYSHLERTLQDAEVNQDLARMTGLAVNNLKASIIP